LTAYALARGPVETALRGHHVGLDFYDLLIEVFYRKRAHLKVGDGRRLWRAFDKTVRRKPLAGAADAAYGFSIDFRLEIVARSGIQQKRCY
jgi:hypothetical protein